MNTWTPLFSRLVDSSVWTEPDYVCKVFITMLALKDADQVVRYNAFALGRKCWPSDEDAEARVLDALKVLSSPDKKRLEPQPHEGRRVRKVDDGWLILNGQAYEDLMRSINRKAYKAQKQREYRAAAKSKWPINSERAGVTPHEFQERHGYDKTPEELAADENQG